jgi:hypothetical protein
MAVSPLILDKVKLCINSISVEQIAQVNHILLPSSVDSVNTCLIAFGAKGGVFGMPIPYDEAGNSYLEPADSYIVEDFRLWAREINQKMVAPLGAISKATGFTMVIDAFTVTDLLRTIYLGIDLGRGYFHFEDSLPIVIHLLDKLNWCYVPLPGEMDVSVVLIGSGKQDCLLRLERASESYGRINLNDL